MKLSTKQKILIAAHNLYEKQSNFSAEDLCVKTWELYENDFGLEGFTNQHPNSNKVYTNIMGKNSIVQKEMWLKIVSKKTYTISLSGFDELKRINDHTSLFGENKKNQSVNFKELKRPDKLALQKFLNSFTVIKILEGKKEFSYFDACNFWNIPHISNARQINDGLHKTAKYISYLKNSDKDKINNKYSTDDIKLLEEWHIRFQKLFSEKIANMQKRTDERKYK